MPKDEEDALHAALKQARELCVRLPVRIAGYTEPMVPLTVAERDAIMRGYERELRSHLASKPIELTTGEDDLDRRLEALDIDVLHQRPAVAVPDHPQPMVLLSEPERQQLVQTVMRLAHRVRELGDMRTLQQMMKDRGIVDAGGEVAIGMLIDLVGLDRAVPLALAALVVRLEHTSDLRQHQNAALLRDAAARLHQAPRMGH